LSPVKILSIMPIPCFLRAMHCCLLLALCLPLAMAHAAPAKRVALLIGNADYKVERTLKNPLNDADLLGGVLKNELGFDVEIKHDLNATDMRNAVVRFANKAKGADTVLFYFSGHGIRAARRNFLLATEAHTGDSPPEEWELQGLPADEVRDRLKEVGARITLLVLDACRDGPGQGKSGSKGLLKIGGGEGVLIAYAAAEGQTAQDGAGARGPYAGALAQALRRTDLSVMQQLDWVAKEVNRQVPKQKPTREGDLAVDEFLLPEKKPEPPKPPDQEEAAWQVCINGRTEQPCLDYVRDFPNGARIRQVRVRITDLLAGKGFGEGAREWRVIGQPLQAGQVVKDCDICPELVLIPGGQFVMGDDKSGYSAEKPAHRVTVPSFLLGKFEVTQGQWRALMGSNPSRFSDCGDNCPVEQVSWQDAQAYLKKLSEKSGQQYRLTTEAEWEYAARAGSSTQWSFGDDESQLGRFAWYGYDQGNADKKNHAVGGKQPNQFGLYDMHGNVWEWMEDCWHNNYQDAPSDGSVWEQGCHTGSSRVLRGGGFSDTPVHLRSANRNHGAATYRSDWFGFRVARTPR
jgi:formylglycine-generating enzyme required for sulfatase activity